MNRAQQGEEGSRALLTPQVASADGLLCRCDTVARAFKEGEAEAGCPLPEWGPGCAALPPEGTWSPTSPGHLPQGQRCRGGPGALPTARPGAPAGAPLSLQGWPPGSGRAGRDSSSCTDPRQPSPPLTPAASSFPSAPEGSGHLPKPTCRSLGRLHGLRHFGQCSVPNHSTPCHWGSSGSCTGRCRVTFSRWHQPGVEGSVLSLFQSQLCNCLAVWPQASLNLSVQLFLIYQRRKAVSVTPGKECPGRRGVCSKHSIMAATASTCRRSCLQVG